MAGRITGRCAASGKAMDMTVLTIDFEASCLPRHGRSFPIEVGVAGPGVAQSWLIRPHESWAAWDWTEQAQALHGISRERIMTQGQDAAIVMAQLARCVGSARVVADSHLDQYWLDTLAQAAGVSAPFAIDHVARLLDERRVNEARIAAAIAYADRLYPERHRALCDAQWLDRVIHHANGQGAGDRPGDRAGRVLALT